MVTPAVANLIREGKTYQLPGVIQTGKKFGMVTLDDSIMDLLRKRWISPIEATTRPWTSRNSCRSCPSRRRSWGSPERRPEKNAMQRHALDRILACMLQAPHGGIGPDFTVGHPTGGGRRPVNPRDNGSDVPAAHPVSDRTIRPALVGADGASRGLGPHGLLRPSPIRWEP